LIPAQDEETAGVDPEGQARPGVVALVASAGGLNALAVVLGGLPARLPAAIVVQQHLGGSVSVLPSILARLSGREVVWAADGVPVSRTQVMVCPGGKQMAILPDGTCALSGFESVVHRAHDHLLRSLADAFGPRAMAVVLTGGGSDGAAGTAALVAAGGVVLAQSEDTADHPSMPHAAAAAGATLVVPLDEIADTVAELVRGGTLPRRE
jgi:two-component system chemotaxis response regulator CheB